MINEEALKKIGVTKSDFDEELKSESDLISSVTTSGRLYRKALQYIVLKELRIYLDNPNLDYSDETEFLNGFGALWRMPNWKICRNN